MRRFEAVTIVCSCVLVLVFTRSLHRSKRWEEFPDVEFTFDCSDKSVGFYADLDFDCQIFQMCDAFGRRVPHVCPNFTRFNQKFRVCDWSYNVDCEDAPNWYFLNDITFERDPEDIDDNALDSDY